VIDTALNLPNLCDTLADAADMCETLAHERDRLLQRLPGHPTQELNPSKQCHIEFGEWGKPNPRNQDLSRLAGRGTTPLADRPVQVGRVLDDPPSSPTGVEKG
jgi:hypothetical protein